MRLFIESPVADDGFTNLVGINTDDIVSISLPGTGELVFRYFDRREGAPAELRSFTASGNLDGSARKLYNSLKGSAAFIVGEPYAEGPFPAHGEAIIAHRFVDSLRARPEAGSSRRVVLLGVGGVYMVAVTVPERREDAGSNRSAVAVHDMLNSVEAYEDRFRYP